jgi:hypothetical protein
MNAGFQGGFPSGAGDVQRKNLKRQWIFIALLHAPCCHDQWERNGITFAR